MGRSAAALGRVFERLRGKGNPAPASNEPTSEQLAFFRAFMGEGSLVFDAGSNIGDKAAIFVALGAHVVAFEPQPACAALVRSRFEGDSRVEVVQAGVARQEGRMTLHVCSAAPLISTFSPEWKEGRFKGYAWDESISVAVMTLDDAIVRFGAPQFIKVDVEGFEVDVLAGLSTQVAAISFEFAREFLDKMQACLAMLHTLGYREFNIALAEESSFVFEQWASDAAVMDFVEGSADDLLWGDIYARAPRSE